MRESKSVILRCFDLGDERAFSYTELLTVLVIVGVLIGLIHTVLITNGVALDESIVRSNLCHDANTIFETVAVDGRRSQQIDIIIVEGQKSAIFYDDLSDPPSVIYLMSNSGELSMQREGYDATVLTKNLDFDQSNFKKEGKALKVTLVLKESLFSRDVSVSTSSEFYPRN
ncbi:MAG: hypothetical protein KKD07_09995 [Candidatus Omnitrophica bacterium]|nr:hypothetical protein [Candidatus Omnitrophota bacterium]MBU1995601.1 hypothetical protein [Candidatus Omnitrophota bacterium]MBU4334758.1 hypothetical protein [Candidatus Omnitrophota bacterium]